jgi:hypothetical protein
MRTHPFYDPITKATELALHNLRSMALFQWYVIPLLVIVLFIYFSEIGKKNWRAIAAGLMLYGIHWFVEIINALIGHFFHYALWTVPTGSAFIILVGVGIEISMMFSIAGIAASKILPENPKQKMFGLPAPLFVGISNALIASVLELFLVRTPTFVWIYDWWGFFPVFILVYIPFFCGATYAYYWKPKTQIIVIGSIWVVDIILLVVFLALGWI